MKKILLALIVIGFATTSCKKAILKETTIAIDTENTLIYTEVDEDGYNLNYFVGYEDELITNYRNALADELGRGKIDIVSKSENPDFILSISTILYQENVGVETVRENWNKKDFDISTLGLSANMTLTKTQVDVPQPFNVWLEKSDKLTNSDDCDNTNYHVHETSIEDIDCANACKARKKIKKMIKAHQ